MATPTSSLSVGEALHIALRRWWVLLGVGAVIGALVYTTAMKQEPIYQAEARLGASRIYSPLDQQLAALPTIGGTHPLNTERERLYSRPVLENALDISGARKRYPYNLAREPEQLVYQRLDIELVRGSQVLQLSLRDENPQNAVALLGGIIEAYQRSMKFLRSEAASGRLRFLREQLAQVQSELPTAVKSEHEYRTQHAVLSESIQDTPAAQRLRDLTSRQVNAAAALAASEAILAQIEAIPEDNQLHGLLGLASLHDHPLVQRQLTERTVRQAVFAEADRRYGPRHPRWQEAHQSLDEATTQLKEVVQMVVTGVRAKAAEQATLSAAIESEIATVGVELLEYRRRIVETERLAAQTLRLADLERQLIQQVQDEAMASQALARDLDVFDPPSAIPVPINIRRKLFLAMAVVIGLCCGWMTAALVEFADRRISAHRLGNLLPQWSILATIPRTRALRKSARHHDRLPATLRDTFRALAAASLFAAGRPGKPLTITLTSPSLRDGRTTIGCHFAAALARSGKRVLLIDSYFQRPRLHNEFATRVWPGFAELLDDAGKDNDETAPAVPHATGIDRLHLLPAGNPNSTEGLIQRSDLAAPFAAWKQLYDVIVVIAPPLGLVPDALALAEHSDAVLLVVRNRVTTRRAVLQAQRRLAPFADRVIGVVLNASRSYQDS